MKKKNELHKNLRQEWLIPLVAHLSSYLQSSFFITAWKEVLGIEQKIKLELMLLEYVPIKRVNSGYREPDWTFFIVNACGYAIQPHSKWLKFCRDLIPAILNKPYYSEDQILTYLGAAAYG